MSGKKVLFSGRIFIERIDANAKGKGDAAFFCSTPPLLLFFIFAFKISYQLKSICLIYARVAAHVTHSQLAL